jgi:hypothetical protein
VEVERIPRERSGIVVAAYAIIELHGLLMALHDQRSETVSLPGAPVGRAETIEAALRRGVEGVGKNVANADLHAIVEHRQAPSSEAHELAFLFDVTISGVDPFSVPGDVSILWVDPGNDADLGGLPAALSGPILGNDPPLLARWWPAVYP